MQRSVWHPSQNTLQICSVPTFLLLPPQHYQQILIKETYLTIFTLDWRSENHFFSSMVWKFMEEPGHMEEIQRTIVFLTQCHLFIKQGNSDMERSHRLGFSYMAWYISLPLCQRKEKCYSCFQDNRVKLVLQPRNLPYPYLTQGTLQIITFKNAFSGFCYLSSQMNQKDKSSSA